LLYGKDENDEGSIGSLKKRIESVTYKDVLKESHQIRSMGNFASAHYLLTEDIIKSLEEAMPQFTTSELKTQAKELIKQAEVLKTSASRAKRDYADLSVTMVSVFLSNFGWQGSLERLREVLTQPAVDISWSQKMLTSMANVSDDILRLTAKAIVSFKEDARNTNIDLEKKLIKLKLKLEKAGIKDTYWMYNKDENGVATGDYVTERDWNTYERKRDEIYNKFKAQFGITYLNYLDFDEANRRNFREKLPKDKKQLLDNWLTNYKAFRAEYLLTKQETLALIKEKQSQLSEEDYRIWEGLNVQLNPKTGKYTIPRKLDSKFNEIKNNPLKLEFYNEITKLKSQLEASFPEKMRHPRRVPQLRRDNIERIKVGDIKSIGANIAEHFKVMDDESERGFDYGVEDETGKVISFVPVYYTKRLSNLKDLSLDSVSTIMEFARMANEYKNMTTVMDILEINKDVLYNRKVFKKNNRNLIVKTISKIAGEEIERKKESPIPGGKIYEMYDGVMEMLVYGKLKAEGRTILGVDVQKFLDSVGAFTAVRQLGLNLYSPMANVLTGGTQLRVEAMANEFFGEKDLLWADGVYGKNLVGVLNDLGSRLPSNKMTLWNEYMDVMEDFSEKTRNLRVEEKTRLSKLFRTSHVFFMTHMGDHYMQMKGNLATAKQFKFDPDKNRFVKKKDYFSPIQVLEDEMRAKIKANTDTLKGQEAKHITKRIKDEYEPKIKQLRQDLNTKWNSLTNFWEAHEVIDNELKIKKEFSANYKEDKKKFILLSKALNQSFHGVYNENDRALIQRRAEGRLVMMFRKFMKPNWDRRFQKAIYDQRKETEVEGYYVTAARFITGLFKDYQKGQFSLYRNWNLLTNEEKANFRRVAAEGAHLIAALALAAILTGLADDDDEWIAYYMAYQANRMITEVGAFVPYTPLFATESLRLLQTPMAAVQPIQETINFMQFWDWGDEITRGKYKGMKFQRGLIRTIPLGKSIQDWSYPEDKLVFYKFL